MQNNPLVSIVVPCFNMEKYLPAFMTALLSQSYRELDIILVDDGSTDKTGKMLDDYATQDSRICVVHQQNSGVSSARLAGFRLMRGSYWTSVDADDFMERNYIGRLVETALAHDADFVYCDYDKVYAERTEQVVYPLSPLSPANFLKAQLAHDMWGTYWNKLIRTSLLKEHDISPIPGITIWDDYVVVNACVAYAKRIAYCPHILYHYNQTNANSVTKQRTRRGLEEPIIVLQHLEHHLKASGILPNVKREFQWQCLRSKRWMLTSEFRDFEAWRRVFKEINIMEIGNAKGLERLLVKEVISRHDRLALLIHWTIRISRRLRRYL